MSPSIESLKGGWKSANGQILHDKHGVLFQGLATFGADDPDTNEIAAEIARLLNEKTD